MCGPTGIFGSAGGLVVARSGGTVLHRSLALPIHSHAPPPPPRPPPPPPRTEFICTPEITCAAPELSPIQSSVAFRVVCVKMNVFPSGDQRGAPNRPPSGRTTLCSTPSEILFTT